MSNARSRLPALERLPRNARNAILLEPLWAIFGTVVMYYAPLYMTGIGLSSPQVGLLGSLTLAASLCFQTLAAPITNRLGRKRTTLIWDLVSWTLPMFIWAFSDSFAAFLLAALLSATGRIVSVSWSLLVIEDVEPPARARVFGILNTIVAVCGLLTPLVGLLIAQYGVVPTLRGYYFAGGIGMTIMFLWRNAITSETRNGTAAMLEHRELHPWQSFRENLGQVGALWRTPGLPWVVTFYVATVFLEQMSLFQILFFEGSLRFGAAVLSWVPVAVAVVTVLMYNQVLRRLRHVPAERGLVLARGLGLIGALLILLIPSGNLAVLLCAVSVLASATFLTQTYRDTVLFDRLPHQGTADLYSAVQILTMLFSIPAAGIAGWIFSIRPISLFAVIAVLNVGLLLVAVIVSRQQTKG